MAHPLASDTRRRLLQGAAGAALAGAAPWAAALPRPAGPRPAVYRTLHTFDHASPDAGGASPMSPPVQMADGLLWGTTNEGGELGFGTIYAMTPRGRIRTMHSFKGTKGGFGDHVSATPGHRLVQGPDGDLWGTVFGGGIDQGNGSVGKGTVFRYRRGGRFSTVHRFGEGSATGTNPEAGLVLASDGHFYGTTGYGGVGGNGTVFRVAPDGEVTDMHVFRRGPGDGARIGTELVQASDGGLWGVTPFGGTADEGIVFRLGLDGSFAVVHHFAGGAQGGVPTSALVQGADGALYGTCFASGRWGTGLLYRITLDGVYTPLHSFSGEQPRVGKGPEGALVATSDGSIYGVTRIGSREGSGSIYRYSPGGGMQPVHAFAAHDQKVYKSGLSQGSDGRLYGTFDGEAPRSAGAVFSLTLLPG